MSPIYLALAGVVVAALAGAGGYRLGADRVQGRWDAAELQRTRDEGLARARQVDRSIEASTAHEAERRRLALALRGARNDLNAAMQQPITCPKGEPIPLARVPVPAAVVDGLRRAGADPGGEP